MEGRRNVGNESSFASSKSFDPEKENSSLDFDLHMHPTEDQHSRTRKEHNPVHANRALDSEKSFDPEEESFSNGEYQKLCAEYVENDKKRAAQNVENWEVRSLHLDVHELEKQVKRLKKLIQTHTSDGGRGHLLSPERDIMPLIYRFVQDNQEPDIDKKVTQILDLLELIQAVHTGIMGGEYVHRMDLKLKKIRRQKEQIEQLKLRIDELNHRMTAPKKK